MRPSSTSSSSPRTYGGTGLRFPVAGVAALAALLALEILLRVLLAAGTRTVVAACRPAEPQMVEGRLWGRAPHFSFLHEPGGGAVLEHPDGNRVPVAVNSMGFHDVEWPSGSGAEPGPVLVLGDSHAAQVAMPVEGLWPRVLGRRLAEGGGRAPAVVNLAVGGASPGMEYEILQRYGPLLRPATVILQFTFSDPTEMGAYPMLTGFLGSTRLRYRTPGDRDELLREARSVEGDLSLVLCRRSLLVRALRSLRGMPVSWTPPLDLVRADRLPRVQAAERTAASIRGIARLSAELGARFLLVVDRGGDPVHAEAMEDQERVLRDLGGLPGAEIRDTRDGFEARVAAEGLRMADREHFTPEGHEAFAGWILDRLGPAARGAR